jgi:hypothetical protein
MSGSESNSMVATRHASAGCHDNLPSFGVTLQRSRQKRQEVLCVVGIGSEEITPDGCRSDPSIAGENRRPIRLSRQSRTRRNLSWSTAPDSRTILVWAMIIVSQDPGGGSVFTGDNLGPEAGARFETRLFCQVGLRPKPVSGIERESESHSWPPRVPLRKRTAWTDERGASTPELGARRDPERFARHAPGRCVRVAAWDRRLTACVES